MYLMALVLATLVGLSSAAAAASAQDSAQNGTVIRITAGDTIFYATLNDTQTARDFHCDPAENFAQPGGFKKSK